MEANVAIAVTVVVLPLVMWLIAVRNSALDKLASARTPVDESRFMTYFSEKTYSKSLIRSYRYALLAGLKRDDFPFDPSDNFYTDYQMFETNVRDVFTDVSLDLKFGNPSEEDVKSHEKLFGKIQTVGQGLYFLHVYKKEHLSS